MSAKGIWIQPVVSVDSEGEETFSWEVVHTMIMESDKLTSEDFWRSGNTLYDLFNFNGFFGPFRNNQDVEEFVKESAANQTKDISKTIKILTEKLGLLKNPKIL